MGRILTQTLGYPRIGTDRELKRALEAHWRGKVGADKLLETFRTVQRQSAEAQADIDRVGAGDATLYDHVLDWTLRLGLIPTRFKSFDGLELYFAMAKGAAGLPALELTKWYDTNYHYLVPEIEADMQPSANFKDFVEQIALAQELLGERTVPVVLGPVTLLSLARLERPFGEVLEELIPLYVELLSTLKELGVAEVQLHEPRLVLDDAGEFENHYREAYQEFARVHLPINLVTYFDDLGDTYAWAVDLPVAALTLDFTRGDNLSLVEQHGWPKDKTLCAGLVDGRSIWAIGPAEVLDTLNRIQRHGGIRLSASSSLQFVPYRASIEKHLPEPLKGVLAFAEEKLAEIVLIGRMANGESAVSEIEASERAWSEYRSFAQAEPEIRERIRTLETGSYQRHSPYSERRPSQIELPRFPITTIGSYPQTAEVRRLRGRYKRGEISQEQYEAGVDAWIGYTIGIQEGMGLDILVHGEFERSDMVEFFAEKLNGFALTESGWVQSYGNRYVRPPIIWGDIRRTAPMTVREFRVAQSFTEKPVKGMLTGPVTILNWSYSRTDVPRKEVAFQLALALREEIADLEAAGARVIQVDEPALREGLPLKRARWEEYLEWAVDAFRLTTGGARDETQVHTHMCYSEFGDIYDAIDGMNADVISIENARSGDETLHELAEYGYSREVGPGVYDIHSPNIPSVDEVKARLKAFSENLRPEQIWVNPDCGLKTRNWDEVLPALGNMAEAARQVRAESEAVAEPSWASD
ncbi:MAG: 5-methyltetrahydropteroyltriglutamate--homocysteine S-methyltransferase [Chloroflexi bacterium]|nr:MAG: 5-methyltetrahydropteroyltriglutamate--homocysteine S-methyltransferase [Chloroflexota bacterium]